MSFTARRRKNYAASMLALLLLAAFASGACSSRQGDARGSAAPESAIEAMRIAFSGDARVAALARPRAGAFVRMPSALADDDASRERIVSEGWRSTKEQRFADLGARLPDRADGVVDVGVSRFEAQQLHVVLAGAASAPARVVQGRVVYSDAFPGTDRVLVSDATALEELLVLRDARAPRAFTWNIQRPAGLTRVVEQPDGFAFVDDAGTPKLVLARPTARDARGAVVALDTTWNDASSSLTVGVRDAEHAAYPLVVDPRYETSSWIELRQLRPLNRQGVAIAYDALHDESVMLGGENGVFADDTWVWSGVTHSWKERSPTTRPPGRGRHATVYDGARHEVLVFGGFTNGSVRLADTWAWDGTNWTNRTPASSPPARSNHTLAYDSTRSEVVLFGGISASGTALADTWVWNGAAGTWTQRAPATSPSARYGHASTYDAMRGEVLLFGGSTAPNAVLNDTWVWSGSAGTWTRRTTTTQPSARNNTALVYDSTRNESVLLGGQVGSAGTTMFTDFWVWNGSSWTQRGATPIGRASQAMAYDVAHRETIAYGGDGAGGIPSEELWTLPSGGTTWTVASPLTGPSSRVFPALAFDSARSEVVLFGGNALATNTGDTWIWNGATAAWTQRTPATSPPARAGHRMLYDPNRHEVVLFGGASGTAGATTLLNDTWAWNGATQTWTRRTTTTQPTPRAYFGFTYDAARSEGLLFGGQVSSSAVSNETWTWHGDTSTWTRIMPATSPPARSGHELVFDSARAETVLFGGVTAIVAGVAVNDTWTWNGSNWALRAPITPPPPPRYYFAMTFDASRREVLVHSGLGEQTALGDTWVWNGTTNEWSQRFPMTFPDARYGHAMAFDGDHRSALLFGNGGTNFQGDTWLHTTLGGGCTSNSDCVGADAYCTDGVCCNTAKCSTCATCNGASPGRCTDVLNHEDPDTCREADGKSCSNVGDCRLALGKPAVDGSECASGYVVDGVCCDSPQCGLCETCDVAKKERNEFPGRCSAAKSGTDPHEECSDEGAPTCGKNGQCDGNRGCALYARGTVCDTNRYCSGAGQCTAEGGSCDGDHTVVAPNGAKTDCGAYKCEGSGCKTSCINKSDCAGDADCTPAHECVQSAASDGSGGGCATSRSPRSPSPLAAMTALLLFCLVSARSGSRSSRTAFAPPGCS